MKTRLVTLPLIPPSLSSSIWVRAPLFSAIVTNLFRVLLHNIIATKNSALKSLISMSIYVVTIVEFLSGAGENQ